MNRVVGTYRVRLQVRADRPLTLEQLEQLDGGRHEVTVIGRQRSVTLDVTLTMPGGDVVGAVARSLNAILDVVPGTVCCAEVIEERTRPGRRRRAAR